jgi:hypothetical protein
LAGEARAADGAGGRGEALAADGAQWARREHGRRRWRARLEGEVRRRGACVLRKVEGIEEGMGVCLFPSRHDAQARTHGRRGADGRNQNRTKKNIFVLVFLVVVADCSVRVPDIWSH